MPVPIMPADLVVVACLGGGTVIKIAYWARRDGPPLAILSLGSKQSRYDTNRDASHACLPVPGRSFE